MEELWICAFITRAHTASKITLEHFFFPFDRRECISSVSGHLTDKPYNHTDTLVEAIESIHLPTLT